MSWVAFPPTNIKGFKIIVQNVAGGKKKFLVENDFFPPSGFPPG